VYSTNYSFIVAQIYSLPKTKKRPLHCYNGLFLYLMFRKTKIN
jgi:hypothetical protein